jgi:hypothetical protein
MKKVFFALFVVSFVTAVCFAENLPVLSSANDNANSIKTSSNTAALEQASSATAVSTQMSESATSPAQDGATNFTGKVYSVLSGSGITGTDPQITVKDDKGQKKTFRVPSNAAIIGKDGNSTTLTWIDKDDNVSIAYITDKEGATAKSIKVSSD